MLLNGTPGKKSKKKKKDKDREKEGEESQSKNAEKEAEVENTPKIDTSELLNSSTTSEKKKKKKDKNRTFSPQPDTTPAVLPKSPKKSVSQNEFVIFVAPKLLFLNPPLPLIRLCRDFPNSAVFGGKWEPH